MSQNSKVEAKIVEELKGLDLLATVDKPVPRPIEWDDIPKLTYLNAVIKVCRHASNPGALTKPFSLCGDIVFCGRNCCRSSWDQLQGVESKDQ